MKIHFFAFSHTKIKYKSSELLFLALRILRENNQKWKLLFSQKFKKSKTKILVLIFASFKVKTIKNRYSYFGVFKKSKLRILILRVSKNK